MTIGIIVNDKKDIGLATAEKLAEAIFGLGGKAILTTGAETGIDFLICIGGDGTLIRAARDLRFNETPILGVNVGTLGYLTEVEISQIDVIVRRIFDGDYRIEERMMLSICRGDGLGCDETALNELAIVRGESPHVVKLKIYLNGAPLDVYPGDGILVSTPTGSTAYSLSAGGPIIDPSLYAISIVPICPHVIFSRPVVVAPDKEITIAPVTSGSGFMATVSIDGFRGRDLLEGETIKVRKSERTVKMLRFYEDSFYTVLKRKLFYSSGKIGAYGTAQEKNPDGDHIEKNRTP